MEFEDWILQQKKEEIPKIRKEVDTIAFNIYHERFDPVSTPDQQLSDTRSAQEIEMMEKEGIFYGYRRKSI